MNKIEEFAAMPLFVGEQVCFIHESLYKIRDRDSVEEHEFTGEEPLYQFKKMIKNKHFSMFIGTVVEVGIRGVNICEKTYVKDKSFLSTSCGPGMRTDFFSEVIIFVSWEQIEMLFRERRLTTLEELKKMRKTV